MPNSLDILMYVYEVLVVFIMVIEMVKHRQSIYRN